MNETRRRSTRLAAAADTETTSEAETATSPNRLGLDQRRAAVVLLSGGLDSATALAIAASQGYDCNALTIDYGQRHHIEIDRARAIALFMAVPHRTVQVDLAAFGGSALTDEISVPHPESQAEIESRVPATYVPARNTVFLALALGWAETLDARDLFIGANVLDYSGYPDCRPEFLEAFEIVANLGTCAGTERGAKFKIHAPLLQSTKAEIIERGAELGVPFQLTHSCYDPNPQGLACGLCDACILRRLGFQRAGIEDPTPYAS